MRSPTITTTSHEAVDVECTHCGVTMASHVGSGGRVRYHHCPSCHRWTTSVYAEVLRADTKMRARAPGQSVTPSLGNARERLHAWLRTLDRQDPYQELGVSPLDSEAAVRERYRELARRHHPDRGGDAEKMRRLNDAYERVLTHRQQRAQQSLGDGAAAVAG